MSQVKHGRALPLLAARLFNQPLAVHPGKAAAILDAIGGRLLGVDVAVAGAAPLHHVAVEQGRPSMARSSDGMARLGDPLGDQLDENGVDALYRVGPVAVIPIEGSLIHKGKWLGTWSGETSYEGVQARVRQALDDPSVRGVVFEVDSFGGEVAGAFDTAALIRQLSAAKPTIAILTDFALSAGYLLASAARTIAMPESGRAGSIGVITLHADYSKAIEKSGVKVTILAAGKHKAEGNPYEPLPNDVAARIRADLEASRLLFAEAVAEGRGRRFDARAALATEADDFAGAQALRLGLVDAVGHPNELFDQFVAEIANPRPRAASSEGNTMLGQGRTIAANSLAPAASAARDAFEMEMAQLAAAVAPSAPPASAAAPAPPIVGKFAEGAAAGRALHGRGAAAADQEAYDRGASAMRTLLGRNVRFTGSPADVGAYERGAAAARALLGPQTVIGDPIEVAKYHAGAAAMAALLGKVGPVGSAAELAKYHAGAAAARALLGKDAPVAGGQLTGYAKGAAEMKALLAKA